jgi:hypothetical protein
MKYIFQKYPYDLFIYFKLKKIKIKYENKVGGLTTHWGGRPVIEEVGGGRTTLVTFWGGRRGWSHHPCCIPSNFATLVV